jgi:predicted nucleic acid-binding protein
VKARIYIETSIPSFYFEVRSEAQMVARRDWTRAWWDECSATCELVTSLAVVEELQRGDFAARQDCLALIADLPILAVEPPILEIVQSYIARRVMPADPVGDALHLALASYHRCDFLVTWNCKHLANANKFGQIRRVNGLLGLWTPALVTPLELRGE